MGYHPQPTGVLIGGGVLPLYRGAFSVFYSPSQQGGLIICLHTMKWLQVLLFNNNNLISVICLHIIKWSNSSIWTIDRTLLDATTPGQSGTGSNGNKGVLCIPQSSNITGALPSDFVSYPGHILVVVVVVVGVLSNYRDAVCVFYSPSLLGWLYDAMTWKNPIAMHVVRPLSHVSEHNFKLINK